MRTRVVLSMLLAVGGSLAQAAEVHLLRSGNGVAGGPDAVLTYWLGPWDSEVATPLGAAEFAAAQAGPPAEILTSLNGAWTPTLSSDPLAQWVSDSQSGSWSGATALYAVPFWVTTGSVSGATLDFHFLCDNWLGEFWAGQNEGLFLNGTPIPGTTGGNYATETSWLGMNVGALVNPGPNVLSILSSDVGGPGGLVFSARLTIEGDDGTVAAEEQAASFRLAAPHPNPFNPLTTLEFSLEESGPATLEVFDLGGRLVATLHDGMTERGEHAVVFDAGARPSGLYLARLSTAQGVQTQKLLLNK